MRRGGQRDFFHAFKMSLELFQIEFYLLHSNFHTSKQHSFKIFRHKTIDWSERKKNHINSLAFRPLFGPAWQFRYIHTHTHPQMQPFLKHFRPNQQRKCIVASAPTEISPKPHHHGKTHSVTFSSSLFHVFFSLTLPFAPLFFCPPH